MTTASKIPASLRMIPSIDQLLRAQELAQLRQKIGTKRLTAIARLVTSDMRAELSSATGRSTLSNTEADATSLLAEAVKRTIQTCELERSAGSRRVINATGVVLHTNLGRAPLSEAACSAMAAAGRYSTLEYDLLTGTRGTRGGRVEALLRQLTGAEDALVVNNCAAAALLILSVLAGDGETIVSRGELVEIGGDFRVPDVMATSGTRMIEVGTTNKTHLDDYRRAINQSTRLIMRVHPSNYRIIGFAGTPQLSDLANLAHQSQLPLYEDAGSGQLHNSELADEVPVNNLVSQGADVVSFSGDKLLGSVQAGLIVGKSSIVDKLRRHPLYRALRSDKIRLAALEATLDAHVREKATSEIPAIHMLATTATEIRDRALPLIEKAAKGGSTLQIEMVSGDSAVGGGAAPGSPLQSTLLALTHEKLSAQEIETRLRRFSTPIIARISDGKVLIDLRTVFADEESLLCDALRSI